MPPKLEKGFREIDLRVAANVVAAIIVYWVLCSVFDNASRYVNICILSLCTAYLAETNWKEAWKSGLIRFSITTIGALLAFIPVTVYNLTQSEALLVVVVCVFLIIALVTAKFFAHIYVQCKVAAVSFLLTVYTFHDSFYATIGNTCYQYGIMWIISTVIGVAITVLVMFIFDTVKKLACKKSETV